MQIPGIDDGSSRRAGGGYQWSWSQFIGLIKVYDINSGADATNSLFMVTHSVVIFVLLDVLIKLRKFGVDALWYAIPIGIPASLKCLTGHRARDLAMVSFHRDCVGESTVLRC